MDNVRSAIARLVKAGLNARKMQKQSLEVGLEDTLIFQIWGEIMDAIYALIGEHTETLENSITYVAMTAPALSDERRTEILYNVYKRHYGEEKMPRPHIMEQKDMRKMHRENGGYMTPEGDWS